MVSLNDTFNKIKDLHLIRLASVVRENSSENFYHFMLKAFKSNENSYSSIPQVCGN